MAAELVLAHVEFQLECASVVPHAGPRFLTLLSHFNDLHGQHAETDGTNNNLEHRPSSCPTSPGATAPLAAPTESEPRRGKATHHSPLQQPFPSFQGCFDELDKQQPLYFKWLSR